MPRCLVFNIVFAWEGAVATTGSAELGMICSHRFPMFSPRRENLVAVDFLLRFFQTKVGVRLLGDASPGGAGRNRTLNQKLTAEIPVPVPPLGEQHKIVAILSSVEDAINTTQAVLDQLGVMKKAMLTDLLTRGIPGRHTRFKQTEIGEVPEGWEVTTLGSLCDEPGRYGASVAKIPFEPQLPRYVRITDITADGDLTSENMASISEEDAASFILNAGDVVFARSGATVGKTYVYSPIHGRCAHAGYLICFHPDSRRLLATFLGQVSKSDRYLRWVQESQQTQAQPNINATEYGSLLIGVPSIEEQHQIVAALATVDARRKEESAVQAGLLKLAASLMSALLTGEVRVTPDEQPA